MGGYLGDEELLAKAASGQADSVRRLVDEAGPVVYGFVYARLGGDREAVDDVVQDTFLEAMRSAASFRGESALATWMCAIARHRIARHFEAERRQAAALDALESALDIDALASTGGDGDLDDRDEITRALGRVPVLHRQVLVMKYLDDEPVAAIASALGRTRVQVQSLLQRARVSLRRELEVRA
jgi:RNA polymerase sigma-70 factor (ECF subfamily)